MVSWKFNADVYEGGMHATDGYLDSYSVSVEIVAYEIRLSCYFESDLYVH